MKRRITLDLDDATLQAIDGQADRIGESRAKFILGAVEERLGALERARVDREFEEMSRDPDRCAETMAIERELAPASDAAWRLLDACEPKPFRKAANRKTRAAR